MHTKMPLTNNDIQRVSRCVRREVIENLKLSAIQPSSFGEYDWLSMWRFNPGEYMRRIYRNKI